MLPYGLAYKELSGVSLIAIKSPACSWKTLYVCLHIFCDAATEPIACECSRDTKHYCFNIIVCSSRWYALIENTSCRQRYNYCQICHLFHGNVRVSSPHSLLLSQLSVSILNIFVLACVVTPVCSLLTAALVVGRYPVYALPVCSVPFTPFSYADCYTDTSSP